MWDGREPSSIGIIAAHFRDKYFTFSEFARGNVSLKWRVIELKPRRETQLVKGAGSMVPIKYEIGPATEKFGTRLIIDVHGDVIAEVPMLLNSKMSLDERCAERDRRAHMIVNALNNQESGKSPM